LSVVSSRPASRPLDLEASSARLSLFEPVLVKRFSSGLTAVDLLSNLKGTYSRIEVLEPVETYSRIEVLETVETYSRIEVLKPVETYRCILSPLPFTRFF
jgi:hypothetical protein